jgi:ADP-heptose:LPS heptosyltransferase
MRLPGSASDPILTDLPNLDEAYIMNPYAGKEQLTFLEALDLLSALSAELYADGINRYGAGKTAN